MDRGNVVMATWREDHWDVTEWPGAIGYTVFETIEAGKNRWYGGRYYVLKDDRGLRDALTVAGYLTKNCCLYEDEYVDGYTENA